MLIKGGHVTDPVTGTDEVLDIRIEADRILDVERDLSARPGEECIMAEGMIAAPGLMDAHVHFRDPGQTWKEDIFSGAAAAAAGGFTRVVCMANTVPVIDEVSLLEENLRKGEKSGIHVLQAAAVTKGLKGEMLTDMEALAQAGACGFTDDGVPLMNERILYEAMEKAKKLGLPISLHEEDPSFVEAAGVNRGRVSEMLHYPGASALAEEVMTARDCMIALHTGARICIQHISSGRSVELVRMAKKMGADVHAEATPHHFSLTQDAVLEYGTNARMNPPLRTEADRLAILDGLRDGTIDMIVTDHAPHSREEKERPMEKAPSGIIGLETSLGLGLRSLVNTGCLTLMELIRKMSTNPALFYGLEPSCIRSQATADLVLFAPEQYRRVEQFASRASNSPFLGWNLPGKIFYTICAGRIVYCGR